MCGGRNSAERYFPKSLDDSEQPVVIFPYYPNTPSDAGVTVVVDRSGTVVEGRDQYLVDPRD
jgi:hypothetical protein